MINNAIIALALFGQVNLDNPPTGWISRPTEVDRVAKKYDIYRQQLLTITRLSKGDKDNAYLWRDLYAVKKEANDLTPEEESSGQLSALSQGNVGCCVGSAFTHGMDVIAAINIRRRKELREHWVARGSQEGNYGLIRYDHLSGSDGATGAWMAESLIKRGTLNRLDYGEGHDLTRTGVQDGRRWARVGIPDYLLEKAGHHKGSAALVKSPDEVRAALQSGYPVELCAQASYPSRRDAQGFSALSGSAWAHAMIVIGYRNAETGREGFLIWNSWGDNWNSGPYYPPDQPKGSFWVSPSDLNHHLRQNDCWVINNYKGFEKRELTWEEVFNSIQGVR